MVTEAANGSAAAAADDEAVHIGDEATQQREPHQQQEAPLQQPTLVPPLGPAGLPAVPAAAPLSMTASDGAGSLQEAGLGSALHSLAAAAAVADDSSRQEEQQQGQQHAKRISAQSATAAGAAEPAVRKPKRMRSLSEDFGPPAGAAAGAMQPQQLSSISTPALTTAEESTAAMSAAAAAAAAAMAAAAEAMRRSGSVGGSRSLQQLGGWEGAAPVPPPAAAAAGQGAAAAAAPHQQWKRTRYSDVNPQQLTPQQQHFYQAQQFHLRQQQQQQQGLGLPAEGEATDMAALQQQQQDDASKADAMAAAAAAAAAAAGGAPEQAAAGADTLHQSLHNRLQQLLLPELGRQAILQSLDPATQCMVECGSATGIFSVDSERILCLCSSCSEGKGPPGPEFMPSEFERHGGMAACKKWRFSIKVADGGPGMTLGRWLDMRGIQISSYPAKARNAVARAKRPLDIGKGLLTAGASSGAGGSSGPTIQLDVSQLLAGLISGNSQLTGALKSAIAGPTAAAGSTGTTAAAGGSAGRGGAAASGLLPPPSAAAAAAAGASFGAAAAAGGAARLNELAAAVADMLVKELPAAAAAAGVSALTAAGTSMPAEQSTWGEESASPASASALQHAAAAGPAATCMWPETAVTTGPGPDDVPLGYAIAAQVASGMAVGPGLQQLQQLQQQHSTRASALGSVVAGQGVLGMIPSTGSATNVLRLPGPGQAQGLTTSGKGSLLTGSLDQLPPLHSGHSMQNSSSTAIMQMLQRHQQAAGQLHSAQLTPEQQRLLGAMQPAMLGVADKSPSCVAAVAAAAARGSGLQQLAGTAGPGSSAAAGMQGIGSPGSTSKDAAAAAAAAAAAQERGGGTMLAGPNAEVPDDQGLGAGLASGQQLQQLPAQLQDGRLAEPAAQHSSWSAPAAAAAAAAAGTLWRLPQPGQWDSISGPLGASHARPPVHFHPHMQHPGLASSSAAAGRDGGSLAAAAPAAMQRAASTATVDSGGSGGNAAAPAAAAVPGSGGYWSDPGLPAAGGRASLASDVAGSARAEFVVGPGSSAQLSSLKSEPDSVPGMPNAFFSSRDAAQTGQAAGLPHVNDGRGGAAAAVAGSGAMGAVESLRTWVTPAAGAASGAAAAAAAPHAQADAARVPTTPSADFKKLVGSVESRLDGLLEDRRRRKQLEEQLAAQGALLAQLQVEFAEERRRRLAAEQQLAALSALLADKLEDDAPGEAAAAAAAAAPAGVPGSGAAAGQLQREAAGPAGVTEKGRLGADPAVVAAADQTQATAAAAGSVGGAIEASVSAAAAAAGAQTPAPPPPPLPPAAAAASSGPVAVKHEAAPAEQQKPRAQQGDTSGAAQD